MTKQTNAKASRCYGKSILKATLLTLILTALSVPARAGCGPGPQWVRTCGGDVDKFSSTATADIQFVTPAGQPMGPPIVAVFSGPTKVVDFDAVVPGEGAPFIQSDLVTLDLADSQHPGVTLRAGLPGLRPSFGRITQRGTPFTMADSFFDVFFELEGPASIFQFGPLTNRFPFRIQAVIDRTPPINIQYTHGLQGVDLFDRAGVLRARLVRANHTPVGDPPPCSVAAHTYAGALWVGNTQKCAMGTTLFQVSDGCADDAGVEADFSPKVSVRQSGLIGDAGQWRTWSSPPFSETRFPQLGFPCASADDAACSRQGAGASMLTIDLLTPASIVAMELEPNQFGVFPVSVQWRDGPGGTGNILASTTLGVEGNSGARVFAGICPTPVIKSVKISTSLAAAGFGIAQLRSSEFVGIFAPEEPVGLFGPVEVPADATSNAPPPQQ